MTQNRCTTCPRPIPDVAFGCTYCGGNLARRLDQLASLLPELETTVAKLDRIGSGGPQQAGQLVWPELPYRPAVAARRDAIGNELTTWARLVHHETGRYLVGNTLPAYTRYIGEAIGWARYYVDKVSKQPIWPELHAGLRPLVGSLLGVIDLPPDRVYLGPCRTTNSATGEPCWTDVFADPDATVGRCRQCGTVHDVAKSREWLLKSLRGHLARPVEIAGALRQFGDAKVGYSTIARYVERKLLVARGQDGHGRDLFRIGDVLDLRVMLARRSAMAGRKQGDAA